jgi:hypothetical protein
MLSRKVMEHHAAHNIHSDDDSDSSSSSSSSSGSSSSSLSGVDESDANNIYHAERREKSENPGLDSNPDERNRNHSASASSLASEGCSSPGYTSSSSLRMEVKSDQNVATDESIEVWSQDDARQENQPVNK